MPPPAIATRFARSRAERRTRSKPPCWRGSSTSRRTLFAQDLDQAAKFLDVGDSAFDDTLPRADLAAMTAVASAIMNLEEFVVVR